MATLSSLSSYNTYADYKKCGEILKSPMIGEKTYTLLCLQCQFTCLQFTAFVVHQREHQEEDLGFKEVRTKEEEVDDVSEPFATINEFGKADIEDEDKKVGLTHNMDNMNYDVLFVYVLGFCYGSVGGTGSIVNGEPKAKD